MKKQLMFFFLYFLFFMIQPISLYILNPNLIIFQNILYILYFIIAIIILILKTIKFYKCNKEDESIGLKICFTVVNCLFLFFFICFKIRYITVFSKDISISNYYDIYYDFSLIDSFLVLLVLSFNQNITVITTKKEHKKNGLKSSLAFLLLIFIFIGSSFSLLFSKESIKTNSFNDIYAVVTYYENNIKKEVKITFDTKDEELYLNKIDSNSIVYIDYYYVIDDSHTSFSNSKEYNTQSIISFLDSIFVGLKSGQMYYILTIYINE